jgi:hypothetical protein
VGTPGATPDESLLQVEVMPLPEKTAAAPFRPSSPLATAPAVAPSTSRP